MISRSETLGEKKVEDMCWKAKEGERSEKSGSQILWEMEKLWVAGAQLEARKSGG